MKKVLEDYWRKKSLQYKSVAEICQAFPAMTDDTTYEELEIIPLLYSESISNVLFLSATLDIYTLARLLRTPPKQPKDRAKYAIIYVGEAHAQAIRSLLKNPVVGFEMINYSTNGFQGIAENGQPLISVNLSQCLNIAEFEQPFFMPPSPPMF